MGEGVPGSSPTWEPSLPFPPSSLLLSTSLLVFSFLVFQFFLIDKISREKPPQNPKRKEWQEVMTVTSEGHFRKEGGHECTGLSFPQGHPFHVSACLITRK